MYVEVTKGSWAGLHDGCSHAFSAFGGSLGCASKQSSCEQREQSTDGLGIRLTYQEHSQIKKLQLYCHLHHESETATFCNRLERCDTVCPRTKSVGVAALELRDGGCLTGQPWNDCRHQFGSGDPTPAITAQRRMGGGVGDVQRQQRSTTEIMFLLLTACIIESHRRCAPGNRRFRLYLFIRQMPADLGRFRPAQ